MTKKRQAVCIRPFNIEGINYEVKLLEIVEIDPSEQKGSLMIWVRNEKGNIWYFYKGSHFDNYFKELK